MKIENSSKTNTVCKDSFEEGKCYMRMSGEVYYVVRLVVGGYTVLEIINLSTNKLYPLACIPAKEGFREVNVKVVIEQ